MEDKPTVQMDSYTPEDEGFEPREAKTPATIPIDDMIQEQGRPSTPPPSPQYSTPPPPAPRYAPPAPPPPPQQPAAPTPYSQPAQPAPAGATRLMGRPAPPPLLAWLAAVEGPGAPRGEVFSLQPETLIGRTSGQVVLSGDAYVSAEHAKIRVEASEDDEEEHVLVLYDLASANGTFAGAKDDYRDNRIYRYELKDGDYILIGETTLVFKQV